MLYPSSQTLEFDLHVEPIADFAVIGLSEGYCRPIEVGIVSTLYSIIYGSLSELRVECDDKFGVFIG